MASVHRAPGTAVALAAALLAAGCRGEGKAEPNPWVANHVRLWSDPGDYVGGGQAYEYTQADAVISVAAFDARLDIDVAGDESWHCTFLAPSGLARLEPGTYPNLKLLGYHDPAAGGLDFWGEGRGCASLTGSVTVTSVAYAGSTLTAVDLSFEQHCDGGAPALRGQIHWRADDPTAPPGPVNPPPPGLWQPAPGSTPASGNYVRLESDPGDYVGAGLSHTYTQATAVLSVSAFEGFLSVHVTGDERWTGDFQAMVGLDRLQPGCYGNLQRYPFHNATRGGLGWWGEGRGCNGLTGWFAVDGVAYSGTALTAIDLRFEQHCEGEIPALHGKIHWDAADPTAPPGPVFPVPPGLWEPAPGSTPASGNYVRLESDPGDSVGGGRAYTYTPATALVSVAGDGARLSVVVRGDEWWDGGFEAMVPLDRLQPGFYGEVQRYPFHNPARGALDWHGLVSGCGAVTGWFAVDAVTYSGTALTAIDLRFEQHCEGAVPALHGKIHWDAANPSTPPGPVTPVPSGLWQPAPGSTPASGSYVYLESDPGDPVGAGLTYAYTQATAVLWLGGSGGGLLVDVNGDERWFGEFQAMRGVDPLQPGYYGDVQPFPLWNPALSSLRWWDGQGCNSIAGWFAVDAVAWSGSILAAIDLRFEQRCDGGAPALRGQIHWDASDPTVPPGPVDPPPPGLWQPAPGSTPAGGNYVYLESDPGDYVGAGLTYAYTQATAVLLVGESPGLLSVEVSGDERWRGYFQAMVGLDQLQPGYYGELARYPFHNPARGGLEWWGEGRSCGAVTGWFAVDGVAYAGSPLTAIDLRFEQHCEGGAPALRGQIHWDASDPTAPPGPVDPPPPGLWQPAPGSTPASGSYVFLESEPGDYLGAGLAYTYTPATAALLVDASEGRLRVVVNGDQDWYGTFQAMIGLDQLLRGYYGDLRRYPSHNPARGGIDWWGDGRACGAATGWFTVDGVAYSGSTLTAVDLRFELHCDGAGPALHGQVRWAAP